MMHIKYIGKTAAFYLQPRHKFKLLMFAWWFFSMSSFFSVGWKLVALIKLWLAVFAEVVR